jgi:hypothetical protein
MWIIWRAEERRVGAWMLTQIVFDKRALDLSGKVGQR